MSFKCNVCSCAFKTNQHYQRHLSSKKHQLRVSNNAKMFECTACKKKFSHSSTLYNHKSKCKVISETTLLKDEMTKMREDFEKERDELRKLKSLSYWTNKLVQPPIPIPITPILKIKTIPSISTSTLSVAKIPIILTIKPYYSALTAFINPFPLYYKKFTLILNTLRITTSKSPIKNSLMPPSWAITNAGKPWIAKTPLTKWSIMATTCWTKNTKSIKKNLIHANKRILKASKTNLKLKKKIP